MKEVCAINGSHYIVSDALMDFLRNTIYVYIHMATEGDCRVLVM